MSTLMCVEELAYNEIKQRIVDGRLAPGTRLVHRTLSKELGMSPIPLVLALRMLERDGLVVNTPGLGACVRSFSRKEIIDLLRIRSFQEAVTARMCAERATSEDIEAIQAAHEAFQKSIDDEDVAANIQAEMALHGAIVRGAKCRDLERIAESLSVMWHSLRALGFSVIISPKLRAIHEPLVEAISRRNPDEAEEAAMQMMRESKVLNLEWIDNLSKVLETPRAWQARAESSAK